MRINFYCIFIMLFFFLSSPFLFVFGVDHVTCHAGADVNPSENVEA